MIVGCYIYVLFNVSVFIIGFDVILVIMGCFVIIIDCFFMCVDVCKY